MNKKIIILLMSVCLTVNVVSAGIPEMRVELNDIILVDHDVYDQNKESIFESYYNVYIKVNGLDDWHSSILGERIGGNISFYGNEFGGCIHVITIKEIIKNSIDLRDDMIPLDEIVKFFNDLQINIIDFILENWVLVLISSVVLLYVSFKVLYK
jgi:hypothetical protein